MKTNQAVEYMMKNDAFSRWMGIELLECKPGYVKLKMKVREEMLNGFYILHGGLSFALADSAMAFAANTHGKLSVVTDAHIQFPSSANIDDELVATAVETYRSRKKGFYDVEILRTSDKAVVAKYRGSVYVTSKSNPPEEQ